MMIKYAISAVDIVSDEVKDIRLDVVNGKPSGVIRTKRGDSLSIIGYETEDGIAGIGSEAVDNGSDINQGIVLTANDITSYVMKTHKAECFAFGEYFLTYYTIENARPKYHKTNTFSLVLTPDENCTEIRGIPDETYMTEELLIQNTDIKETGMDGMTHVYTGTSNYMKSVFDREAAETLSEKLKECFDFAKKHSLMMIFDRNEGDISIIGGKDVSIDFCDGIGMIADTEGRIPDTNPNKFGYAIPFTHVEGKDRIAKVETPIIDGYVDEMNIIIGKQENQD